jgi:hypothetical protein
MESKIEQQLLEATHGVPAEYTELWNNLRAGVTVLWEAFKTYFTVVGFLFTACGVLLSQQPLFERRTSALASFVISLAGLLITFLAARGIRRIILYQRTFLDRGLKVEKDVGGQLFSVADRAWRDSTLPGSDWLTYLVFGVFGASWVLLAAICIRIALGT